MLEGLELILLTVVSVLLTQEVGASIAALGAGIAAEWCILKGVILAGHARASGG